MSDVVMFVMFNISDRGCRESLSDVFVNEIKYSRLKPSTTGGVVAT